jgi:hypothetical protein
MSDINKNFCNFCDGIAYLAFKNINNSDIEYNFIKFHDFDAEYKSSNKFEFNKNQIEILANYMKTHISVFKLEKIKIIKKHNNTIIIELSFIYSDIKYIRLTNCSDHVIYKNSNYQQAISVSFYSKYFKLLFDEIETKEKIKLDLLFE